MKHPEAAPPLPEKHLEQLKKLAEFIQTAATTQNLVSKNDLPVVLVRHIQDSLAPLLCADQLHLGKPGLWIDIGSGAGFPILPLAICLPEWNFLAIEPRRLRVQHLRDAASALGLENLQVIQSKSETALVSNNLKNKAAIVSTRAVGKIPEDGLRAKPFLVPGGHFVTYKHNEVVPGIDGYHPLSYVPYILPSGSETRYLVIAPTPTARS